MSLTVKPDGGAALRRLAVAYGAWPDYYEEAMAIGWIRRSDTSMVDPFRHGSPRPA